MGEIVALQLFATIPLPEPLVIHCQPEVQEHPSLDKNQMTKISFKIAWKMSPVVDGLFYGGLDDMPILWPNQVT